MRVPAQQIRRQLVSVFEAWGMSEAHAETAADMMVETDLRGVDSHGIGMLPTYDQEFHNGRLNMRPVFIGHFFMAIDPRAFRGEGEFEDDLDQVIDVLHNAKRVDANQPVLVAGDPERATKRERLEGGVPIPDDLMEQLRVVAKNAAVPFLLAGGSWAR